MTTEPGVKGIIQAFLNFPVTQGYGATDFALEPPGQGFAHFHDGIDYATPVGTPITPFKKGTIKEIRNDAGGLGRSVTVQYEDDKKLATFGHLSEVGSTIQLLKPGSVVQGFEVIGKSGNTGNSTGPHVHFRLANENGVATNPLEWLKQFGGNTAPLPGTAFPAGSTVQGVVGEKIEEVKTEVEQAATAGASSAVSGLVPSWVAKPNWFLVGVAVVGVLFVMVGAFGVVFGSSTVRGAVKSGAKIAATAA